MSRHLLRTALVVTGVVSIAVLSAQGRKFYDDDPLWTEPVTQDVTRANRYEPDLIYQAVESLFGAPGDPVLGQRAKNLNTVDEVPDGPFYVNRAGRMALTPAIVARASNQSAGPAAGTWTVVSAKSDGVTPGFTIRDADKATWFIKFDPPGWSGMATGSEVVAAKLFWAVGYHTAEYYIERLEPSRLTVSPDARITPAGEIERPMAPPDVDKLLSRANRDRDGTYRVVVSKALPGRPVGRIRFDGTRADDPNDIVPHEHRRELRGYFVFAAWLNHVDAKGINSMASLVTEGGRTFIRQYLLDFGSALGSAAIKPREYWEGYEPIVEPGGTILRRTLAAGFLIPSWRTNPVYEAPAIGRLPTDHSMWDPALWRPHITNAAFRHARKDDHFWAARKLMFITNETIAAAVAEGKFGDPASEQALTEFIRARRDRILQRYLPDVNPIIDPALTAAGLTFANAAVAAGVAQAPGGYKADWAVFDNATGASKPIGSTQGASSPLPVPTLPQAAFINVDLSATGTPHAGWSTPVSIFFRRAGGGWELVGFERMP